MQFEYTFLLLRFSFGKRDNDAEKMEIHRADGNWQKLEKTYLQGTMPVFITKKRPEKVPESA